MSSATSAENPTPPGARAGGSPSGAGRPYIGGQAVIEGVMMRSPGSFSIVCRRRGGALVVRERPHPHVTSGLWTWPFARGIATLVESIRLGSESLRWSGDLYEEDLAAEDEERAREKGANEATRTGTRAPLLALAVAVANLVTQEPDAAPSGARARDEKKGGGLLFLLPLVFALALFVALPQLAAEGTNKLLSLGLDVTSPGYQAITGVAKLLIVVGYLMSIRRIPLLRRVFQYHGAEHKTISTYEAGEELTVANARQKTMLHPRCGTTFLVMVALVSIVMFTVIGAFVPPLPVGRAAQGVLFFLLKLPFLPLIAGVTFEIQRLFARRCTRGPLRALLWPGFLVQKITTIEPDDDQLEVALASLRATLWREQAREAPTPPDRTFPDYASLAADPGYVAAA